MCTGPWEDRRIQGLTGCTEKTAKQTTDIILYDGKVIVFKMESDVMLYVVGGPEENEVLLYRCAACLDLVRNALSAH